MNFMRSEMSRKQRMACCNEVWVSVLWGNVRARVTVVDRLCDSNALCGDCRIVEHCACVCNEMRQTYHTGAVLSSH